jgi:hypothetical protein
MSSRKHRLTVTVDRELVAAAHEAVATGRAGSLSAWVNLALEERAAKERRLQAMADAVAAYEAQFGIMSAEELVGQARADRESAVVVRGPHRTKGKKARRRGGAA